MEIVTQEKSLFHKCQICRLNIDPNNKTAYANYQHSDIRECLDIALGVIEFLRDGFDETIKCLKAHHADLKLENDGQCETCKMVIANHRFRG